MVYDAILVNDWHPVMRARDVTPGSVKHVRLLGEDIVLWNAAGTIHAMRDLCIHRGAKLSLGKVGNDCIICPYHGWHYDATGRCVHMPAHPNQSPPAKAHTAVYRVTICYKLVWVCIGTPTKDVPPFPEWDAPNSARAVCGPFPNIRAHGPRLIENYLDAAHFPFVHEGVLGDPTMPVLGEFDVRIGDNGVESDPIEVYQPNPFGGGAGLVTYTYHAYRAYTAHFTKHVATVTNGMVMTLTPHDDGVCTVWFIVATNSSQDSAALEISYTPRIAAILDEDIAVVESQRPELLPLDLQAELHLRSDRVAIAYRRWLAQIGLKVGVA